MGDAIPLYKPRRDSFATIDRKQSTVPLYLGFLGSCVCKWTLTVSKGCPTRTPAQPDTKLRESLNFYDLIMRSLINVN